MSVTSRGRHTGTYRVARGRNKVFFKKHVLESEINFFREKGHTGLALAKAQSRQSMKCLLAGRGGHKLARGLAQLFCRSLAVCMWSYQHKNERVCFIFSAVTL